jgi:hypothetical protein
MISFNDVSGQFETIKKLYDAGGNPLVAIREAGAAALTLVTAHPRIELADGYLSYGTRGTAAGICRPIRDDLYIASPTDFVEKWNAMVADLGESHLSVADADRVLYTCIQSFAAAYDLFRRASRKTPGTFFEIMVGSVLSAAAGGMARSKQVVLQVDDEPVTVPTDIYFEPLHLIVATKTSTKDRIVQPWGHQLLLDRIGAKLEMTPFRSILCAVGEVQLAKEGNARMCYPVCVPKQVKLYQQHVAQLTGLYYLDPPRGYLNLNDAGIIPVRTMGTMLGGQLP